MLALNKEATLLLSEMDSAKSANLQLEHEIESLKVEIGSLKQEVRFEIKKEHSNFNFLLGRSTASTKLPLAQRKGIAGKPVTPGKKFQRRRTRTKQHRNNYS